MNVEDENPKIQLSLVLKAGVTTAAVALSAGFVASLFASGAAMIVHGLVFEMHGRPKGEALFAAASMIACALPAICFGRLTINLVRDLLTRNVLTISQESIIDHRLGGFRIELRHVSALQVIHGPISPQAIRIFIDRFWPPTQSRFRFGCFARPKQGEVTLSIAFLNPSEDYIVAVLRAVATLHDIPMNEGPVRPAVPRRRTLATG